MTSKKSKWASFSKAIDMFSNDSMKDVRNLEVYKNTNISKNEMFLVFKGTLIETYETI